MVLTYKGSPDPMSAGDGSLEWELEGMLSRWLMPYKLDNGTSEGGTFLRGAV